MSQVEEECDRFIRSLGGEVVTFSVPHKAASSHVGLPDRRYRLRGVAFFAEIKGPGDKASKTKPDRLTQAQLDFLGAEYDCGQVVFAGDVAGLRRLVLGRPSEWRHLGWQEVAEIALRGIR